MQSYLKNEGCAVEKQGGQVGRVRSKDSDDQRAQRAGQGQIM